MNESLPQENTASLSALQRIDGVCDQFEEGWRKGDHPRIEDYLAEAPEGERTDLLGQLLKLELELRVKAGERVTVEQYRERFPFHADLVVRLVKEAAFLGSSTGIDPERSPGNATPTSAHLEEKTGSYIPGFQYETKEDFSVSSDSTVPFRAGHYRLEERIGVGGMGEVYRAIDSVFNRKLAVKILLEKHKGRAEFENRFLEEAQILGQLQHPGVVPAHEIGRLDDGRPFFAMKLVQGQTLEKLLQDRPVPLHDLPRFLTIFEQICQTMANAHDLGVIHRDLKPSNVMVGAHGEVQVMDWGLAKVLNPARNLSEHSAESDDDRYSVIATIRSETPGQSTRTGNVMGTLAFMPPELASGQVAQHDKRSDVFLLGGILCVILTGQPPYQGSAGLVLQEDDLNPTYGMLERCGADFEVIMLARACLAADREVRPRDAGVVAERIVSCLASARERLGHAEIKQAETFVKSSESRKRHKWQFASVAGIALACLAGERALSWHQSGKISETKALAAMKAWEARKSNAKVVLEEAEELKDKEKWQEVLALNERAKGFLWSPKLTQEEIEKLPFGGWEQGELLPPDSLYMELCQQAGRNQRELWIVQRSEEIALRHVVYAFDPNSFLEIEREIDRTLRSELVVQGEEPAILREALRREYSAVSELADPFHHRRWNLADSDKLGLNKLAQDETTLRKSAIDIIHLAEQLWCCNFRETAVQLLQKALPLLPDHFWINYYLGVYLSDLTPPRHVEAHACWRAIVAMRAESPGAHYALGISFRRLKQLDEASAEFRQATVLQRKFAELPETKAHHGVVSSKIEGYPAVFWRTSMHFAQAHKELGAVLLENGQLDAAIDELRKALSDTEKLPEADRRACEKLRADVAGLLKAANR